MPNWVRGVEAGSKIRTKINQKTRSTWEGIVVSIFGGFWWILGDKLGGKNRAKRLQKWHRKIDRIAAESAADGRRTKSKNGCSKRGNIGQKNMKTFFLTQQKHRFLYTKQAF